MKHLRHPIRAIREPFGTAGLIVAMVALVAALGGTALAAAKLNSTQKKEVEKIAKKFAGKAGAVGATGPVGAAGPVGTNGKEGVSGKDGSNGTNGTSGSNGVSPTGTNFTGSKTVGSTTCTEGGIEYKGAATNLVCNGKEGSPWTASGTLPSGRTLKGEWNADSVTVAPFTALHTAVSYALPLSAAPNLVYVGTASAATGTGDIENESNLVKNVHASTGAFTTGSTISGAGIPAGASINAIEEGESGEVILVLNQQATATATGVPLIADLPAGCNGSAENPTAESGNLCVYAAVQEGVVGPPPNLGGTVQPLIGFTVVGTTTVPAGHYANLHGTWAVTAP